MKLITGEEIQNMHISPAECMAWVRESFSLKAIAQLPAKISLHPKASNFFNTMPCIVSFSHDKMRYAVKVVSRIEGVTPSLKSEILLYDALNGELLALLDGDWITAMRTGAVASLATKTFATQKVLRGEGSFAFIGLGNTARATLLCLLSEFQNQTLNVKLVKYKEQAEVFVERFADYKNVRFCIVDTPAEAIQNADVIISCITAANGLICEDDTLFKKGSLLIPVHTRGFQNCDLSFDKVFADDTEHVRGFKYFNQFKSFGEIQDVIAGKIKGRTSEEERILSYNIGLGLHDLVYASKIFDAYIPSSNTDILWSKEVNKFWV